MQFEGNVSDMEDAIGKVVQRRLTIAKDEETRNSSVVLYPGAYQIFDTAASAISVTLERPTVKDSGTFVVVIDIAAGTNPLTVRAAAGCQVNRAASTSVATFGALFFCDGRNYWRLL